MLIKNFFSDLHQKIIFNQKTKKIENDFIYLHFTNSIHILNTISPVFTASFSLVDLIIDKIEKNEK